MTLLAPGDIGLIAVEPTPSRLDLILDGEDDRDCVHELLRLAQGGSGCSLRVDWTADAVLLADTEQLAKELEIEYAAVRAAIRQAKKVE